MSPLAGPFTPDETARARGIEISGNLSYQDFDPAAVTLEPDPIIADADIVSYDAERHVLRLSYTRDRLSTRLGSIDVYGKPFVVSVDEKPIFGGWFWNSVSSVSCWECIVMGPDDFLSEGLGDSEIELGYGYPQAQGDPPAPDPRKTRDCSSGSGHRTSSCPQRRL